MPAPRQFLENLTPLTEDAPPSKVDEVVTLTAQMGEALNTLDFTKFDFDNHMAAEYTVHDDHHLLANYAWRGGTISLAQRLEEHKEHMLKYPDYRLEIYEMSTFVDERGLTADVFIPCKTVGLPEIGRCGEGVMILRWVWQSPGKWVVVKGTALRGSAGQSFA